MIKTSFLRSSLSFNTDSKLNDIIYMVSGIYLEVKVRYGKTAFLKKIIFQSVLFNGQRFPKRSGPECNNVKQPKEAEPFLG